MIDHLKKIFGLKCTALFVNGEVNEFINVPSKKMKFCEAVKYSFKIPIRLINENLGCPGARRSVGFDNNDNQLSISISENTKISVKFVREALSSIAKLQDIRHINLGLTNYMVKEIKPDLIIAYIKPDAVTAIMHELAKQKIIPSVPPFSLLSVCGNVFSNCYKNNEVSISFGCPESRKYGGIEENELVIALPYKTALFLTKI